MRTRCRSCNRLPKAFRWLRLRKAGRWLHTALRGPFHRSRALLRFLCGLRSSSNRRSPQLSKPPVARGPVSGSPLEHIPKERLLAVATHRYASDGDKQLAIAELNRRAQVAADANKTSPEYNNFLQYKRANPNYTGDWLQYQQDTKADVSKKRLYDAAMAERKANGEGPYPGGMTKWLIDTSGGTKIDLGSQQETAFQKEAGTGLAKQFQGYSEEGDAAAENLAMIGGLRGLKVQTGLGAFIRGELANRGVDLGGDSSDLSAYSAFIDKMTPQQRPAGAGATSDFDAKMYKAALPGLMRLPGGNEIILNQMEALSQNRIKRAAIADAARTPPGSEGHISPAEALKQLRELRQEAKQIGLDAVKLSRGANATSASGASTIAPPPAPEGVDKDAWAAEWQRGLDKVMKR